ncbi:Phosphate transport system permease protein pstA [Bacteroidales bacterium Barb6]|nr:Phosphate transport system permease protein pstA [Bacteroidales bacterium Barb4]OAV69951.1 Phosphate transport system permease protein pstA [Bacteroidales bacterium Barb6XT]OAV72974.1 Phosphate transport system permease protein pstA [Bacteroidales bacterium Barb6]OAV75400.1 Phosphate transport system permease protein pstA [Bacteroidales bacterium Barb7]
MKLKFIEERIFNYLMVLATLIVFGFFFSIIGTIVHKGFPPLTWEMVTSLPGGGFYLGKDGGILNAIAGSLLIVSGSTMLGLLISIPVVFYINVYLKKESKLAYLTRLTFDVLFGIPSIVYGAFAFTIMIFFGLKTSLLGGIIVITLLIIPIFIRSMDEVAKSLSKDLLHATYSLGATKLETAKVILLQIAPGIVTATLLSIGRAIGDAAGVMFTAGFTDNIPTSLGQPAATLPLSVFFQLGSPIPEVRERAYAAALLLTLIVLTLSIGGRLITSRFTKNRIK